MRKYRETGLILGHSRASSLTLAVPGGLAGQLFAIGYAAWISSNRQVPVHIQFHHLGSGIGRLGAVGVLETEQARKLGISFSEVDQLWPPSSRTQHFASRFTVDSILRAARASTFGIYAALQKLHTGQGMRSSPVVSYPLTASNLLDAPLGSIISGYPTDYRIIEESWGLLSSMISSSGYPDFVQGTGKEETVAVHWRLGDYVQNKYHGTISGGSLSNCLKYANTEDLPIKIFTDSPDLVEQAISKSSLRSRLGQDYEVLSGDIWSDLFGMTRSKVFIGSHSGVSFLAALALRSDNVNSETWLPNKWFLNKHADWLFSHGPKTAQESAFYPAELVTSPIPT